MTVTIQKRAKSNPQYYVYYNDWTGEIISVGHAIRNDITAPLLVTQDDIAHQIIKGNDSDQNYVVSNLPELVSKSEYLRLRICEEALYLLPNHKLEEWDIRVKLYKNKMLVFEVNQAMISHLVAQNIRREIQIDGPDNLEFHITKDGDPDYLIQTISFALSDLIHNGQIVHHIGDVARYSNPYELSFLTRRYFKNYYFEVTDAEYVDTSLVTTINLPHIWQAVKNQTGSHLAFTQYNNCVTLSSNISAEQLTASGVLHRHMTFYVVGDSPDMYLAEFSMDMSRLRLGHQERFLVDFDIDDVNIIYQNPTLKVTKRKINDTYPN
jgi:hypothetical protein